MGNSCAQECYSADKSEKTVTVNNIPQDCVVLHSERTHRASAASAGLNSQPSQPELPRLGLVKQHSLFGTVAHKEQQESKTNLFGSINTPRSKEDKKTSSRVSLKEDNMASGAGHRADSLEILFEVECGEKVIQICHRPLGAEFTRKAEAAKVKKVKPQSYASELGLEVGWVVKAVGGEDVSGMNFQSIEELIKNGMLRLPEQSQ